MATTPVLYTITGQDRPGVTAGLLESLDTTGAEVIDAEQIVIRGELVLCLLLNMPAESQPDVTRSLQTAALREGMSITVDEEPALDDPRRLGRVLVTVMGEPLCPKALAGITRRIADLGGNIDRIERLAGYPLVVVRLTVSGADESDLREALAAESASGGLDVAVQRLALTRRGTHLVVMDVDSTLIQDEVIELIAHYAGCEEEVRAVTEAAMRGELDFTESLHARVSLLAGVHVSALDEVRDTIRLTPGARTLCRTLKRLGYRIAVVSGGFTQVVEPLAARLGADYALANELEVVDGVLTGRVVGPVVDRRGKAEALRRFAAESNIPLEQTVAIGDGANDVDMISLAGLGIAFNAKPALKAAADTSVNVPYLDAVLYVLGITREEVEAADAADGVPTRADLTESTLTPRPTR
ncbi:MAG: phosphoserine phosphatase SerB [Actinobacteria bacterium]|nr:phosphoserine phosphatase SerB [Actinomycetota bacterium]